MNTQIKSKSLFDLDRNIALSVSFLLSFLIIVFDLLTPPQIMLSIFFVIPVIITGWYNGLRWSLILSVTLPLTRLLIAIFIEPLWSVSYNIINAIARIVVLSIVSFIAAKLSYSVKQIKVLEGLIPICANCKKIRDHNQEWQPLEKYITARSDAQFTHGICPDCAKLLYGDIINKS